MAAEIPAALLSVYHAAHTHGEESTQFSDPMKPAEGQQPPPNLEILPLHEAAQMLGAQADPQGICRRRRALAKVVAAGLNQYDDELVGLLEPDLAALDFDAEIPGLSGMARSQAEASIIELIVEMLGLLPAGCYRTWPLTWAWQTPDLVSHVVSSMSIKRDFDDLAEVSDPQNWDECSDLFTAAFVPEHTAGEVIEGPSGDPIEQAAPPPAGQSWVQPFYELFEMPWPIWFKNILNVETTRIAGKYRIDFELKRAWASGFWTDERPDTGVDVDHGLGVLQLGANGWISLWAQKTLKFSKRTILGVDYGFWLNVWAPFFLQMMGEELYQSVCCATV